MNLKPCLDFPCPNFAEVKGHCKAHARPAFYGTNRSAGLPKDWGTRRKYRLMMDGGKCVKCSEPATDVDHIIPGQNHEMDNLQSLCRDCHRSKTAQEGNDAQWAAHRRQKLDTWQEMYLQIEKEKEERRNNEN